MHTQELTKETEAEVKAGIERAAKSFHGLKDQIAKLKEEVQVLKNANLELRKHILEFSKWTENNTGIKADDHVDDSGGYINGPTMGKSY